MTIINCDMGESFGLYKMGDDAALMPHITVANVACGFHASDPNHMRATCRLAKEHGVKVGAHPSLPDLAGFGRRKMDIPREELANIIVYQVGALQGFLKAEGMEMSHIKPHGALYGMAARDEAVANAVADAAEVFGVPLMGMTHTLHETVYPARGIGFIAEFYADLDYADDGFIIITREHPAFDPDVVAQKCVRAVRDGVTATTSGKEIAVKADAICVHSDTPNAADIAAAVKNAVSPWLKAA
ncbi:MAG: 5-oxoprolinase subunit PxpA [Pseudomonadota bacterium]